MGERERNRDMGNMMLLNSILGSGPQRIPGGSNSVGYDPQTLATMYLNKGLGFGG